jgi:lysophospholipase L1-like esterase
MNIDRIAASPYQLACYAILVIACVSCSIAARTMPDGPSIPAQLRGVHRIVCLGDSITEQGAQPGGYVNLLQRYLTALYPSQSIQVFNAGISGHKATDMQARFDRDVVSRNPDLVTISVGVNDVWHGFYDDHPAGDGPKGVPLPVYREKVMQMVEAAKAAKARVVLVSPTLIHEDLTGPENAKLDRYVAEMRSIARETGSGFVDLNASFKELIKAYQKRAGRTSNLLTTDGVHMNAAGNRVMAYGILRGLGVPDKSIADLRVDSK